MFHFVKANNYIHMFIYCSIDVTEAQFFVIFVYIMTGLFGSSLWSNIVSAVFLLSCFSMILYRILCFMLFFEIGIKLEPNFEIGIKLEPNFLNKILPFY